MKKTIIILSFVIATLMIISALPANALSFVEGYTTGDTDLSYEVTIKDATLIQKHIAHIENFSKGQLIVADTDNDGNVTIKDATTIQKYVANILPYFDVSKSYFDYLFREAFNSDIASGLATVDEEVTFFAKASTFNEGDITYEFAVNGEIKQERSTNDEFKVSFPTEGTYTVSVNMYDACDNMRTAEIQYIVTENRNEEKLYIKNFIYDCNLNDFFSYNAKFTAFVGGGSGEYEYRFLLNGETIKDFSEENFYTPNPDIGENTFAVVVRDKSTNEEVTTETPLTIYLVF